MCMLCDRWSTSNRDWNIIENLTNNLIKRLLISIGRYDDIYLSADGIQKEG